MDKFAIIKYLEQELCKMETKKALKAIFCEYGKQNLLTEEFYNSLVADGLIPKM